MTVKIRALLPAELPELNKLIFSLFSDATPLISKGDMIFVAQVKGALVGFAHFSLGKDRILLKGIGVLERYRNQGLGRQLLIKGLKELPNFPVYLKVKSTNDPAISLYVKNGFVQKRYGSVFVMVKSPEN